MITQKPSEEFLAMETRVADLCLAVAIIEQRLKRIEKRVFHNGQG